jgi:hypothetical protein
VVGLVGAALCVGAAFIAPRQFFPAYLVAYWFWLGLTLGGLALSMVHHLSGGGWGVAIRRILESAASTSVLMAALFIPIALGMSNLFVWSLPEVVEHDEILQRKIHYLNVNDFLIRAVIYFAIWVGFTLLLNSLTNSADPAVQQRRRRMMGTLSGIGLVLWGLALTFATVDWGMSLEPHWFSSMYPVIFMGGQAVSAFALSVITAVLLARYSGSFNILSTSRLHDLGNFLLAFVMFWSYVSFLIIWSANLPEETPWYIGRSVGGWQIVVGVLMIVHFLLPFLVLLARQVKRDPRRLIGVAILLLVMRVIDLVWHIMPPFVPSLFGAIEEPGFHTVRPEAIGTNLLAMWPLLITIPAIGGLWLALFAQRLSVRGLIPIHEFPEHEEPRHEVAGHAAH